jgi:HlyD family secretion protein
MDRRMPKSWWTWRRGASLAAVVLLVVVLSWSFISPDGGRSLRVSATRLSLATITRGEFQEFIPATGIVVPRTSHYLDAAEGGRVEQVYREAGSLVEAGDEILRLGNTKLLLDIMYREAELYQQSNNLRNTKILMEQNRLQVSRELLETDHELAQQRRATGSLETLMKDSLVPRREYEEARDRLAYLTSRRELVLAAQEQDNLFRNAQIERLDASLRRMQSNLEIVKRDQENLILRAPIPGQLTALDAEVGQSKARGERLGQIDVLDGYKLRAAVDEYYIARINSGLPGAFTLSADRYGLQVEKVYPQVVDGRFEIDLRFSEREPSGIRRGQTIRFRLELGDSSDAVLLPEGPYRHTTGGRWVYVLDEHGKTARRTEIDVGRQNPLFLEVLDGLSPGDRVITSGYERFGDASRLILGESS